LNKRFISSLPAAGRRFNYLENLPAIEDAEQAGLRKIAVYFLRNTRTVKLRIVEKKDCFDGYW
jgi:hypothetical protein